MAKAMNPYKKYIKAVLNHHADYKLVVERSGNDYYICDGISMLKLPEELYNKFFTSEDGTFVTLNDGETIEYPSASFDVKLNSSNSLSKLFGSIAIKEYVQVTGAVIDDVSDFDHKVKRKIRIAVIGDEIAGFNDEYIFAAKEFAGVFMGTKSTSPIKWENNVMGMIIMPIRANAFRQDIKRIKNAKITY